MLKNLDNTTLKISTLVLAVMLAGCQYKAEPASVPAFNIYSNYGDKVPGLWLLYVEAGLLNKSVKPDDINCAAHTFPLAISEPFASAARQTLANVVTNLEVVASPVSADGLKARNARGMIVVRGENVLTRMRVVPGAWSATVDADVEIVASITADGPKGRLLGTTVSGLGRASGDAGVFCEGGGKALANGAAQGMQQALTRIGEAMANSERVR